MLQCPEDPQAGWILREGPSHVCPNLDQGSVTSRRGRWGLRGFGGLVLIIGASLWMVL